MDPLIISFFSLLVLLVASIIVNVFYAIGKSTVKTEVATTQTEDFPVIDRDTQTKNKDISVFPCDEEIQASPVTSTAQMNTQYSKHIDNT